MLQTTEQNDVQSDYLTCGICDSSGKFQTAKDVATVRCNVKRFSDQRFTVWRCEGCGSLHSKETVDLDRYYDGYPLQAQRLDYGARCAFRTRLGLLKRSGLRSGARILDYGCGNGLFVRYLKHAGYEAFGYDRYVAGYDDVSVLNDSYDLIVSYDVIEHVDDPRAMLERLTRMLRTGGVLVIGTPNADRIAIAESEKFLLELHQPYHRHILSESALRACAKSAGLEQQAIRRRFCFDTIYPFINTQFLWRYVRRVGNMLDTTTDMPKAGVILANPSLLFWGLFGYWLPHRGTMVVFFKRSTENDRRPSGDYVLDSL